MMRIDTKMRVIEIQAEPKSIAEDCASDWVYVLVAFSASIVIWIGICWTLINVLD